MADVGDEDVKPAKHRKNTYRQVPDPLSSSLHWSRCVPRPSAGELWRVRALFLSEKQTPACQEEFVNHC